MPDALAPTRSVMRPSSIETSARHLKAWKLTASNIEAEASAGIGAQENHTRSSTARAVSAMSCAGTYPSSGLPRKPRDVTQGLMEGVFV